MAQILQIKTPEGVKSVHIIRAFHDAGGKKVYLHANGRYAYKDGKPLLAASDLDIIGNVEQREAALRWWKYTGEAESKAYYDAVKQRERERIGDFHSGTVLAESDLDGITYVRRPALKKKTAVSAPHTWREWFEHRPDWWGQAEIVQFRDFIYELIRPEDLVNLEEETAVPAATAKSTQADSFLDSTGDLAKGEPGPGPVSDF